MKKKVESSKSRFEEYRQKFLNSDKNVTHNRGHGEPSDEAQAKKSRDRSAVTLIAEFLRLLKGHRKAVAFSLATLTAATIFALVPPAAIKFVVDYVLGDQPIPTSLPAWVPRETMPLLIVITVGGREVLSAGLPYTAREIEAVMRRE